MFTNITIVRESEDKLVRQEWSYVYISIDHKMILDNYYSYNRPTTRHKWQVRYKYDRLMKRECNIEVNEVPKLEEVNKEAKEKFFESLEVGIEI